MSRRNSAPRTFVSSSPDCSPDTTRLTLIARLLRCEMARTRLERDDLEVVASLVDCTNSSSTADIYIRTAIPSRSMTGCVTPCENPMRFGTPAVTPRTVGKHVNERTGLAAAPPKQQPNCRSRSVQPR